jgi:type I restriction enzyme S subunit
LEEQRRIVAKIETLAAEIEEAKSMRAEADEKANRLLVCMAHRQDWTAEQKTQAGWFHTELDKVIALRPNPRKVDTSSTYPNLGIYSFGRGLFEKPPIEGLSTSATTLFRVKVGQFIYSRLFAFEGAYGVVPKQLDGYYVSNEYPTFDCKPSKICPEFLEAYFKAPLVWQEVATGSKGLGDRRQRVHPEQILGHKLWLPPMSWQEKIADTRTRLLEQQAWKSTIETDLNALLPAILDRAFKGAL